MTRLAMAKLAYACILTGNIERLAAFYSHVRQSEATWSGAYAEFPTGAGIFSLWSVDAYADIAGAEAVPRSGGGATMLEFEVADVDAEFSRLQQLAEFTVEFILPPTSMQWGNRAMYFRDPDGNPVNLFTHVASS